MLGAARCGNWDEVLKLEGTCVTLISRLSQATRLPSPALTESVAIEAAMAKSRLMQQILADDAELPQLAEPWLRTLDNTLAGRRPSL